MRHLRHPWRILLAALAGVLVLWTPNTAFAAGTSQVSGMMVPDWNGTVCTELPSQQPAGIVTGDLTGCWYLTTIDAQRITDNGNLVASGTETFSGCWGTLCGHLHTTFIFTARFDTSTGAELHGRCYHPIVGGDGDFTGAAGSFSMHDDPDGCVFYKGHITLP